MLTTHTHTRVNYTPTCKVHKRVTLTPQYFPTLSILESWTSVFVCPIEEVMLFCGCRTNTLFAVLPWLLPGGPCIVKLRVIAALPNAPLKLHC